MPLRAKSLEVLRVLALNADHLVPKAALFKAVWPDTYASEDSLVQCIREIRQALGQAGPRVIQTEYKRGYRLLSANSSHLTGSRLRRFRQRIATARSRDGASIAYAVSGSGPVVIRPPHWLTHVNHDWRNGLLGPTLMRLSDAFTVVRIDGRGTGGSDRTVAPGTLTDWVADLHAVIETEGIESCSLLGISTGAFATLRYAASNPARVSSIVLIGGVIRGDLHRGVSERHVAALGQLVRDGWALDNPAFRALITTSHWPEASADDRSAFNDLQRDSCSAENAASLLQALAGTDVSVSLEKILAPTLLLHARHDQRVPFAESELASRKMPNARLVAIESANHCPVWNEPAFEMTVQEITRFLQANPGQVR